MPQLLFPTLAGQQACQLHLRKHVAGGGELPQLLLPTLGGQQSRQLSQCGAVAGSLDELPQLLLPPLAVLLSGRPFQAVFNGLLWVLGLALLLSLSPKFLIALVKLKCQALTRPEEWELDLRSPAT